MFYFKAKLQLPVTLSSYGISVLLRTLRNHLKLSELVARSILGHDRFLPPEIEINIVGASNLKLNCKNHLQQSSQIY